MNDNQNNDNMMNTTYDNNIEIPNNGMQYGDMVNNGVQPEVSNMETDQISQTVVTGNTEVLEPVQIEQNVSTYEEVPSQFQEVSVTQTPVRTDSYFDGGLLELIGWRILAGLITGFTLGIGGPWASCMLYNYQYKHTVYNGKRLKFEGTGGDLFVNRFKWFFLSIVTFGIYLFFIPVKKQQWITSNLHFEDENLVKGESFFDGKTLHLIGVNILCSLLNTVSFGLLFTFTTCFKLKWINRHTVINRKKLAFSGKALNLFGKYLLWVFLTLITFGIYGWWLRIKMLKWETKNIHIKTVGEVEEKENSLGVAIGVGVVGVLLFILVVPKLVGLVSNVGITNPFNGGFKVTNPFKKSESSTDYGNRIGPENVQYNNYYNN